MDTSKEFLEVQEEVSDFIATLPEPETDYRMDFNVNKMNWFRAFIWKHLLGMTVWKVSE